MADEPLRPTSPHTGASGSDRAQSYVQLGLDAFYRECESEALEWFEQALKLEPENLRVHYLITLCCQFLTREELLEEVCASALRINPRHPYAVACEAVRYQFLANFDRGRMLFERALNAMPDRLELIIGLGILHDYAGEKDKAFEAFSRALEIDPDNVRAHISVGELLATEGEFDAALEHFKMASQLDPDLENPHQRLARLYYHDGLIQEAVQELTLACQEDPQDPAAHFYLLDSMRRLERTDEALDVYSEIRIRFGNRPDLTSGYFEHFNMNAEALEALRRLASRHPFDPRVYLRLSRAHQQAGQTKEAIGAAERAMRLAPDSHESFALLSELYFQSQDYRQAIALSRRAIKLNPNLQSAYTTLADSLLFLGRAEESSAVVQEMERVRESNWQRYQAKFSGQDRPEANC